ncbi:hypothetical protein [Massilia sp. CCM 8734]|uniref:hypothetical protein n=1 Tax=Massilia sp. CCM 8734 TaxID=2609283 RepID=UPI001421EB08|nr:hypothetical protein [Massilia sp. CCM 8734]NIA00193.1 hypothetical protein [Massilia sp. CCM 8734]
MPESPLTHGDVCVGLEIEGLGRLAFTWNEAGKQRVDTIRETARTGNIVPVTQFAQTFKRTALIRSKSYGTYIAGGEDAQATDNRGVYAVPEEEKLNWPAYGENNPAELVSAPHRLTNDGLRFLRDSIRKVKVKQPGAKIADRIFTTGLAALNEEQKRAT